MIRIFSDVLKKIPNARLLLVGDGFLRQQTENLAKELSVYDKVIFTGKRSDIPEILSATDIFWLPSLFEGVPLSVIEAQSSGLPCVMSGTITREVDFGACTYLDLENEAEWIDTFVRLSETKPDRVGNGKKLLLSSYDIESETEKLFNYYSEF